MINTINALRKYIEDSDQEWNISIIDEPRHGSDVINHELDWAQHNPGHTVERLVEDRIWIIWHTGIIRSILIDDRTTHEEITKAVPTLIKYIDEAVEYWRELKMINQK